MSDNKFWRTTIRFSGHELSLLLTPADSFFVEQAVQGGWIAQVTPMNWMTQEPEGSTYSINGSKVEYVISSLYEGD